MGLFFPAGKWVRVLESDGPGLKSWLCWCLAVWLRNCSLTSLCLSPWLICQGQIQMLSGTLQGYLKIKWNDVCEGSVTVNSMNLSYCYYSNTKAALSLFCCRYLLLSVAQLCPTLCDPKDCSTPGLPVPHHLQCLPKFMSIASVMPSSHLILWCPLLFLPSIFPSIRVFSNESAVCIRWPKYWSFGFSINSSNMYSGSISLKIDWFDLAVQRTFRSLL